MELSSKFLSYSVSNALFLFTYVQFLISRMAFFLDIFEVKYFIFVSPFILASIFYCAKGDLRDIKEKSKTFKKFIH